MHHRNAPVFSLHELEAIEYSSGPSILLFSDNADQLEWLGSAVRASGARISAALGLDDAVGRIADHAAPDGVIVDVDPGNPALAEDIFDSIEQGARSQRFRSIALIDRDLIDLAAARAGHGDVQLLCGTDREGVAAAIKGLLAPRGLRLNDVSVDAAPVKLRELSEEVGRIARTLAALSNPQGERRPFESDAREADTPPIIEAASIRAMIRARRMRAQFFDTELFADPAWDMLLDLTAARLEERPVAVSSLCIAADVPPTTALRWIKTLTELGLFLRIADPNDRRRVFIELSPGGFDAMLGYLAAMRRAGAVLL